MKKQEDTLVKEKLDPSAAAVHAMSAFTDSISLPHQYNNGSAIATSAGQMAVGMPHGLGMPGNPHVSFGTGFPTQTMTSSSPFGMSMKFEWDAIDNIKDINAKNLIMFIPLSNVLKYDDRYKETNFDI